MAMVAKKILLVIGRQGVGKTALVRRFLHGEFHAGTVPTVGLERTENTVPLDPTDSTLPPELVAALPPEGAEIEIWEIGGKERYRQLPRGEQPDGILLCYNVHDRSSFHGAVHMLLHYRMDRHLEHEGPAVVAERDCTRRIPTVLVGCQSDDAMTHAITLAEAGDCARKNNLDFSLVASALTGESADTAFHILAQLTFEVDAEAEAEWMASIDAGVPSALGAGPGPGTGLHNWSLSRPFEGGPLSDPRGLRLHEPPRHRPAPPDLVEVFTTGGTSIIDSKAAFTARPIRDCLDKGLLHNVVHVWIYDAATGGVLLRKYSPDAVKMAGRWGPSCGTEVRAYESMQMLGGERPLASEPVEEAAQRAFLEQLGEAAEQHARRRLEHWFSCANRDGKCQEHVEVFVVPLHDNGLPPFNLRRDESVQWVHFLDIFGQKAASQPTGRRGLFHMEAEYRTAFVQRMRARILHKHGAAGPAPSLGGGSGNSAAATVPRIHR